MNTGFSMNKSVSSHGPKRNRLVWTLAILTILVASALWFYRAPIDGYTSAGTSYAARVACSCRFVAGRSLDSCEGDLLAGMELVSLSADVDAKSVTASYPLIKSDTATYRDGYGCVLQEWQD